MGTNEKWHGLSINFWKRENSRHIIRTWIKWEGQRNKKKETSYSKEQTQKWNCQQQSQLRIKQQTLYMNSVAGVVGYTLECFVCLVLIMKISCHISNIISLGIKTNRCLIHSEWAKCSRVHTKLESIKQISRINL